MLIWASSLLEAVPNRLSNDSYWCGRLQHHYLEGTGVFHLAVFVEPFLQFVLDGRKTVESRFSVNRCPPYNKVKTGDIVLVKRSSGPVVAIAEIASTSFYELRQTSMQAIQKKFGRLLCIEGTDFLDSKQRSCYATLIGFSHVTTISPIPCAKRDRRGWVVLGDSARQSSFLFDSPIGVQVNGLPKHPTKRREHMAKNDRYVVNHEDGWGVKSPGGDRVSSHHDTQREAELRAKEIVENLGGGEVRIQGRDGKWRDSDTVAPGNDPNPPRDRKH